MRNILKAVAKSQSEKVWVYVLRTDRDMHGNSVFAGEEFLAPLDIAKDLFDRCIASQVKEREVAHVNA